MKDPKYAFCRNRHRQNGVNEVTYDSFIVTNNGCKRVRSFLGNIFTPEVVNLFVFVETDEDGRVCTGERRSNTKFGLPLSWDDPLRHVSHSVYAKDL